jgi:hypothetical protein
MRKHFSGVFLLVVSVAPLTLGCESATSSSPSTYSKTTIADEKVRDAENATAAAAKATTEAVIAKRDEYAREMNNQLDELDAKLAELKDRAVQAEGQAKKNLDKKLDEAKVKRDAAAKQLEELKLASAERWEKIKVGMGKAVDDLKGMFE